MSDLERAWAWREQSALFKHTDTIRVFHGPGEGRGAWTGFAIDRFLNHYWVTEWEASGQGEGRNGNRRSQIKDEIVQFLKSKDAVSVVGLSRPQKGLPAESQAWWGNPPLERIQVREDENLFWIQLQKTRHPGLFLDHRPLRQWLRSHVQGLRVLNTFAYTGSLSVASANGGAKRVTTLDLSRPAVEWARENFTLNQIPEAAHRFMVGDVFEGLPRLKREKEVFDCILLDPPSFAHGKKGSFSTAKDLMKLHSLAMDVLAHEGFLITSINSSNIPCKKFEADVLKAASEKKVRFLNLGEITLPETFPTVLGQDSDRYLKGWILKRLS